MFAYFFWWKVKFLNRIGMWKQTRIGSLDNFIDSSVEFHSIGIVSIKRAFQTITIGIFQCSCTTKYSCVWGLKNIVLKHCAIFTLITFWANPINMRHYLYKNNSQVEEGVGNQLFGEFFLLVVKQISIWVKCKFIHTSKVAFVNSFILKHHKTFTNHSVKKL